MWLKSKMSCMGIVTNVNTTFLFFELDNDITVHMSILMSQNKLQALPVIGSKVVIKNAHKFQTSYFACKSSTLKGNFCVPRYDGFFLKLVVKHQFGIKDLFRVKEVINLVENNFKDLEQNVKTELIHFFLENIINLSKSINCQDDMCLNECMSQFKIITPHLCKYVEIQSNKFNKFPYWSFGVHTNPKNTLLFGHLTMHPMYGFLLLKDKFYQIPCIIYNTPIEKYCQIHDSYVSIEKYRVMTEIYQETNVPNVEYLLIDHHDINIIYTVTDHNCLYGDKKLSGRSFKANMYFQLKRKSMIQMGNDNIPECWFQILIVNVTGKEAPEEAFLILPSAYVKIIVNFKEGLYYTLFYNMPLKVGHNTELTRMRKINIYEIQDSDTYFLQDDKMGCTEKLLTVTECKKYILNNTDLVSFQGTLKSKRFANALQSYTIKKAKIYGFGTPGSKVHQLVFCVKDGGVQYLDCYLNNWENILMPLGLIPEMQIIVRNVYPQSKKYVKSSAFTTFEIAWYAPLVPFNTVNLHENDHLDWGCRSFLGYGDKIPYGVLIWGKVTNVQILSLSIKNLCSGCKFVLESLETCLHCCQLTHRQLYFLIKMHVSDEFGQSKVLAKFPGIMKSILDLQEHQFQVWLKAIEEIGCFEYNFFEDVHTFESAKNEVACFKRCLTNFVKMVNEHVMLFLDLKCRKLDFNPEKNGGRPLWLCIDARRS